MERLDRLDWAAGISLTACGTRIGIRATRLEPLAALAEELSPVWRRSSSPIVDRLYSFVPAPPVRQRGRRHYHVLYADAARIARAEAIDEVRAGLAADAQLHLAVAASGLLFVHAGVVLWRSRALLLPGPSRAGKSTLVAALVGAGATYFSDEFAILDPDGRVRQHPAPLSLRPDVAAGFADTAAACRPRRRDGQLATVAATVLLRHEPGAALRLRRITAGETVLGLVANTVAARLRPQDALRASRRVAADSRLRLSGVRGDAAAAAARLLDELDRLP